VPGDGVIEENDLAVLYQNWLSDFTSDLVMPEASIEEAYSAPGTSFEGLTWDPNSHKLFFSRRTIPFQTLRLDGPNTVYPWLNPSPQTNGTIMSLDGRLLCCDESTLQITSRGGIGSSGPTDTIVLATGGSDSYTKKPNDLCQLTNRNIYFTDPDWTYGVPPAAQGIWPLEPNGAVRCVNNALNQPNGIITSLDETKLYVSEGSTNASYQRWWVFNIGSDYSLSGLYFSTRAAHRTAPTFQMG
jgi:sugar lactone lactonase YvrE